MRLLVFLSVLFLIHGHAMSQNKVDVLIVGGGAGGTAAGIQAARSGAQVQIIEATPWLGGMLTAAGVSAIDGNHELPSGIWGEFREELRKHYGSAGALATGWVSHTLFEPAVGERILRGMAKHQNLWIEFNASLESVSYEQGKWKVTFKKGGELHSTIATVLIDATETGELLPLVGADFRFGMDAKSDTGEDEAPAVANDIIQDLTYVAILEDVSSDPTRQRRKKGLVKKPKGYDPENYACACKREEDEMFGKVSDCEQMLNYGKLPNNKYMINWPNCGNDYYINWAELSEKEFLEELKKAKAFTLGFIYYIQNELGFQHLRLADEFPTKDQLPFIPYHREGRRAKGKVFLTVNHLEKPYDYTLYRTGVAVGDYPIDHHHDKNENAPEIAFINIRIPSYNLPMGVLIPENTENFLVADKNISVSNIVNGTTRLQPVVLGIGQAAGAIAATAIKNKQDVGDVSVREVQNMLLRGKAYLMPFIDVSPEDAAFESIQRIGAMGILKGYGIPYKWANQTFFYPDRMVSEYELKQGLLAYYPELEKIDASGRGVKIAFLSNLFKVLGKELNPTELQSQWNDWEIEQPYSEATALNRKSVSVLLDKVLSPFDIEISLEGKVLRD
ncbi:FAD-dependent oxidoreductase [Zhouia amylolytica]|uniref:FAD-dependent oxidoreductase n=1 Tax=Zhouia amylolytica TaxID=376730 RepID=UPI0020CE4F3C|nr:FAD-dependent oxidoreductase [Zhouia amylolytica]MCQ0113067.1 FAD-dependent oxidoreductase [Zhouia amylolytica]